MLGIERKAAILAILQTNKSASVRQLSKELFASEATIRRDLDKLEQEGLIKRAFGGAVPVQGLSAEIPLYVRETEQQKQKDAIGRAAQEWVKDGGILIVDSSTTAYAMTKFLTPEKNLTILTNGAKTAIRLGEMPHTTVYCTGGRLRQNSLSYVGDAAVSFIRGYHADILFFSCRGVVPEHGLYDSSTEEAELRRAMLACADKKVLLCDNSKIGNFSFHRICGLEEIDVVITDAPVSDATRRCFEKHRVCYAEGH